MSPTKPPFFNSLVLSQDDLSTRAHKNTAPQYTVNPSPAHSRLRIDTHWWPNIQPPSPALLGFAVENAPHYDPKYGFFRAGYGGWPHNTEVTCLVVLCLAVCAQLGAKDLVPELCCDAEAQLPVLVVVVEVVRLELAEVCELRPPVVKEIVAHVVADIAEDRAGSNRAHKLWGGGVTEKCVCVGACVRV